MRFQLGALFSLVAVDEQQLLIDRPPASINVRPFHPTQKITQAKTNLMKTLWLFFQGRALLAAVAVTAQREDDTDSFVLFLLSCRRMVPSSSEAG